jgi:hypothetical protein
MNSFLSAAAAFLKWFFGLNLSNGEVFIAGLQLLLAVLITGATAVGVFYAAAQFRVANTIKYLEEFRTDKMKEAVNRTRAANAAIGPLWKTYGMLTHIMDFRGDPMHEQPLGDIEPISKNRPRAPTEGDKERFKNAADLKYISNYFDYVGVLMERGIVDRKLFFRQLCDVTISNWRVLRAYVYYQRLAIRDGSAAEHLDSFKDAARTLARDPATAEAAEDLNKMILAYDRYGAENAVGGQHWFEWLFGEALEWRREHGAEDDRSASVRRRRYERLLSRLAKAALWLVGRRLTYRRLAPARQAELEHKALVEAIKDVAAASAPLV